jgi:hypothetical protein
MRIRKHGNIGTGQDIKPVQEIASLRRIQARRNAVKPTIELIRA